jgi:protein involved in sex pheromone biosynthesis
MAEDDDNDDHDDQDDDQDEEEDKMIMMDAELAPELYQTQSFYRQTRRRAGRIVKSVQECYLRDDLGFGSIYNHHHKKNDDVASGDETKDEPANDERQRRRGQCRRHRSLFARVRHELIVAQS